MASSSSKFDLSSGSPDRPLYSSGQRPHGASSLDRSGSFRESMDNSASSSHGNLSRNSSSVGQAEVLNFFQCLPFGSKPLPLDHRSNRHGDLKRNIAVAIGISPDNSPPNLSKGKLVVPPSQEDLKRVKLGLRECSSKARERVKLFDEALCLVNKFFPAVSTKKRSRSEGFSNDRSGLMLSSDRSMLGQGLGKAGSQNNNISVGFEHELQKSEERIKSSVPSKRRTSLADLKPEVRGHGSMRPSGPTDRDRELPKLANSSAQSDDRALSIGVDGWEKTKMKKKRSIIKPDAASAAVSAKPIDGYRETKQGMQQRSISNPRMRLNGETHGIRSGFGNGAVGNGKGEAIPQQIGLSSRASIPKVDGDGNSIIGDKRDRTMNSDKERVNLRAVNKPNCRDDFNSSSPTLNPKMNASVRGPRSSSGATPKMVPVANRATPPHDWDATHCTTRPPAAAGANNRKRTASARSSSPPTVPYSPGQPPKSNRSARRTNLGPSLSSNDEASPLDTMSDAVGNEAGLGFPKRLLIGSPKLKGDLPYSPSISEGEDSVGVETKPRDRFKKSDELDEKSGHRIQKPPTLSTRKTKLASGEGQGDGIRKQGRTGRGYTASRSALPLSRAKVGHEEAKQLRSTRISSERNESKAGRPSTRKLSDRKTYARQRHTSINISADFLVGSDDGHEELLAAANAVVNPTHVSSESFWREKEPLFGFISDVDIDYLKQQENFLSASRMENLVRADTNDHGSVASVLGLTEVGAEDQSTTSLCERLLASLIPDDEAEYCINENGDIKVDAYGSRHGVDGCVESNGFGYDCEAVPSTARNGYMVTGVPSYHDHGNGNDMASILRTSGFGFDRPINGLVAEQGLIPCMTSPESSYKSMDMNEKLLMEMNSIGIFPEASPKTDQFESGGIDDEINKFMEKHQAQASKTKSMLDRLLISAEKAKESQEKEFEQLALDKLVGLAYQKYMMCFGHGGKSSSNKMAKQAAMAFVKRTLERCKQFETTGRSCFSEPLFREIFQSGSSRLSLARVADSTADHVSEQPNGTEDTWLNRVKKRELLLDDVIGSSGVGNSIASPSGIGPLVSSTKGKRSERDREGKGVLSRAGTTKNSRSSVSNAKGERKSKAKPKQKTTQLSVSINGLVSSTSDQSKPQGSGPKSGTTPKEKVEFGLDPLEEPLDFSQLQLPGMDVLGSNDLGGQGEDLTSWLNMVDDDNLQDHDDFLGLDGLEIPMDDLSDLNMMV